MGLVSFARGVPAPECLPVEELADCARVALERDGRTILLYGPGGGYGPLREWLAERHGVEPSRVVLTNGSLQGFVFLAEHLVHPGTRVLVEAPTYDRPLKILARLGAEIVALPMDDDGLLPDALEQAIGERDAPAFLYTIATFQNPSGRTMSEERRRRVVEIAQERNLLVLEDDPYGLVRYEGEAPPLLFDIDGGEHVAYASSFSKTIAPGVRVGYFVLPADLASQLEALAVSTYISPPFLTQATVHEFLRRGAFEPNLVRVQRPARARAATRCSRRSSARCRRTRRLTRPEGGYFIWVDVPSGPDTGELLPRAEAAGVTFVKGADFFSGGGEGSHSLRLAFSFVSPDGDRRGRLAPRLAASSTGVVVALTRRPAAGETHGAEGRQAAACAGTGTGVRVRGTSGGCFGGARPPDAQARNVGQIVSPGSAQRPARLK